MIVTIVADVLGKENNGTTKACMNLARYLRKCGDQVRMVCSDQEKKGEPGYYIVPKLNLGPINRIVEKNGVSLSKPDHGIIEKAIEGSDIVHVMMPFPLGRAAARIAKRMGVPVSAGFHCQAENVTGHLFLMNCGLANFLMYRSFYRGLYRRVDSIHYPTEFIKNVFESNVYVSEHIRPYVISNGVNDEFVSEKCEKPDELKDKFVILFTGRFSREKSHHILLKAVKHSRHKDRIQLIFAGAGPRAELLRKKAEKYGINAPIMKFFPREELVKVINYSDLYCHPAEIEIEAIACLEAISCGLVPVISNSKRSATKFFAKDDKSLFKTNDSKDLAKKIDFWIEHPVLREEYGRKYAQGGKLFKQEECMRRMRIMLAETAARKKYEEVEFDEAESYLLQ